ncbi:MAG TPA: circadian clock KaiB family protein [Syntrophales bacterium]|nr:circadian clock KaiB family protein [Syntrophales bacterium]
MRGRTDKEKIEKALEGQDGRNYVLRLYIAGMTPKSTLAITNIKKICEEHLEGRYSLEVIDLYKRPSLADGEQIIAAPTLLKKLPLPLRRFIGDMSDTEKIIVGLDLRSKK